MTKLIYVVKENNVWKGKEYTDTSLFNVKEDAEEYYNYVTNYDISKQLYSFVVHGTNESYIDHYILLKSEGVNY